MENIRNSRGLRLSAIFVAFAMMFTVLSFGTGEVYAAAKPAQVKNVKMSASTATSITVKWGKAKNAKEYQVAYKKLGTSKFKTAKVSKLSRKITGLAQDTTYCIKVRGVNGKTYGKWSAEKKFTTKVNYAKAVNEKQMTVKATADKMQIKVAKLSGLSGTAKVYGMAPNEYLTADKLDGIVSKNSKGYLVGSVSMSKGKSFAIDRVVDGYDRVYDKYYLVFDGAIVKGPVYATTVASENRIVTKQAASKKGLVDELSEESFAAAEDLGTSWTSVNIDFTQLMMANEDAKGNAIDNSGKTAYTIDVNGKTYYLNEGYVNSLDYVLGRYEQMGINTIAVVVSFTETESWGNYPKALKYIDDARWTNGFNTSTAAGRDYFIAGMEFLADRYSAGGKGLISNYVIGNEIDYAYDWNEIIPNKHKSGKKLPARNGNMFLRTGEVETTAPLNDYMAEYARTLRIANTAVKQYSKDATVSVCVTREWAKSIGKQNGAKATTNKRFDSYAPKEVLDWLNYQTKKGGDFNWALTPHNYPLTDGNAAAYETGLTNKKVVITGKLDSTPKITQNNFELYQVYLNKSVNKCNGKLRSIYLTENGCSSGSTSGTHSATMQKRQAAAVAQLYYRAASLPSVKAIAYYRLNDRETEGATDNKIGLIDTNGKKKLAYDVWKYIDTDKSFTYADKYLGYISYKKGGKEYSKAKKNIKSYYDVMTMTSNDYSWKKNWNKKALTPVKAD